MEPYIGEIRIFPYYKIPETRSEWAICDGGMRDRNQEAALFSIIGYNYGGKDGKFALPDMRGRAPLGIPKGDMSKLGIMAGFNETLLTEEYIPKHTHTIQVADVLPDAPGVTGNLITRGVNNEYGPKDGALVQMAAKTITSAQVPLPNMQPFIGLAFYIAVKGIYPQKP
ncbi:tail fiber protein [Mucilaginibacter sp. dw_454]|uniref:phage tail protein n=1 Tax=Mucilaginibacter sp. dw_454 TaxID=2720079 RepID=UPI001BD609C1|nr:tail fiber protein [Mucilaginibacter sp. dw_454]